MEIKIHKIKITNFKGIKDLEIDFNGTTNIFGANGTGKTTVADAFSFLLFGKDTSDKKDFSIRPKNADGSDKTRIESEVYAEMEFDGEKHTFKHIFKENYVKKRGSKEEQFTGNEHLYFFDDVPMQLKEYKAKIDSFIQEETFKLVTNVNYFNSLSWQDRRKTLIAMAGNITNADVAYNNPAFQELLTKMGSKSMDEFARELAAKKKKSNDELKQIPTRIDELEKTKPEPINAIEIGNQISTLESEISHIEHQIYDSSEALKEQIKKSEHAQRLVFNKRNELREIEYGLKASLNSGSSDSQYQLRRLTTTVNDITNEIVHTKLSIDRYKDRIEELEQNKALKLNAFELESKKQLTFDDANFCCPTCKRAYEANDIEAKKVELQNNFKIQKNRNLDTIEADGLSLKKSIEDGKTLLAEKEQLLSDLQNKLDAAQIELDNAKAAQSEVKIKTIEGVLTASPEYQKLKAEIESDEQNIPKVDNLNTDHLQNQKRELVSQVDSFKAQLSTNSQIEKADARIKELSENESKLAQEVADFENLEFTMLEFQKAKMSYISDAINKYFEFVSFKMFDTQINGGETPTCITTIDGVPYNDANTASKINAGMDIINALSRFYNVSAPIFIDNSESITDIIPTDSQIIKLIVDRNYKKLHVA
ncbi:ATP-binding protein [Rhizosphaericola mali]|uniref:AAA family ATPase n=1 Tax=Rhizosphaericola mali TaxID=2545455 RepID=A0A5P2G014_9BACT|nr:AAA family ATPase [Rhizosphaericola mali]QES88825.1 AAA family ATPase [Rhizosphaericola mali]